MVRTIRVKVQPKARVCELKALADGSWLARVKAPPVDGKANEDLIGLVAKTFGRQKSQVTIKSGQSARLKVVQIDEG